MWKPSYLQRSFPQVRYPASPSWSYPTHSGLLPSKSQSLRNQDRRGSGNSSQPALKTNGQETQLPLLEAKDICELASLYDVGGSLT